jgi:23S rRNA (cytidine1920-2'-O)/16S rRNA (cytidine1409-2'-O)-methyltransferase
MSSEPSTERVRLDVWLVDHGLADSREKAQALVMAGRVRVDGAPATKAGTPVGDGSVVQVIPGPQHVGRGALKLAGALDALGLDPRARVVVDVGASTGGFTETLLERGALRVYAVDVGRGQLHEKLSSDRRVVVVDAVNARAISPREVPEACALATVDVSFISVLKVLPALRSVLAPGADVVVLVKPQFELGRFRVGRGGVVRDAALHLQALRDAAWSAERELGYAVRGACSSPITGAEGNREFFLHLVREGPPLASEAFDAMMAAAVAP